MLTIEETRALSEVHPEFKPIIESESSMLGSWAMDTDIHAMRDMIAYMREMRPKPDPKSLPYLTEELKIPLRDGFEVNARVYKPRDIPADGCPGFVVFHGGGFVCGDLETEAYLCAHFTSLGGIAVNIDYRHAPEHVFPQAIHDAFDATKWQTAENVENLGINPKKGFLIGGESSGADIVLAVSHLCRDDKMSPPLTGVFAPIPSGANESTIPEQYRKHFFSKEQNANAPLFSTESLNFVHANYQPDEKSPLAWPVAFPDHGGIPKTYFQVCGLDPVRDCGLVLEQVYRDAGIPTKLDVYAGLPHGFWAMFPELTVTKKRTSDTIEAPKGSACWRPHPTEPELWGFPHILGETDGTQRSMQHTEAALAPVNRDDRGRAALWRFLMAPLSSPSQSCPPVDWLFSAPSGPISQRCPGHFNTTTPNLASGRVDARQLSSPTRLPGHFWGISWFRLGSRTLQSPSPSGLAALWMVRFNAQSKRSKRSKRPKPSPTA
ncbi:hypothetical protein G7Z17_g10969 [Cylindrodendrum hubeiense]|uniref:Alpha/beta hydrolase fold-3 domain-containing protein n=1 Tax=Cylindrodendrum hubeiense TaxID=595255 RepID=A0A9P5H627_9HYPO|nr:hypothetical protein G7Z17_g10969 [Cylindrodendrum hubeiense]